jgi:CRP-like cAMP-binding protein
MSKDVTVTLGRNKLFETLGEEELAALSSITTLVHFKPGEVVFREGEMCNAFYQIAEGKVSITKRDSAGVEREVASLGGNELIGEMALLSDMPRSATVTCTENTRLLRILTAGFDKLLESGNVHAYRVIWHMSKILCKRMCGMNEMISEQLRHDVGRDAGLAALHERLMKHIYT